MAGLPAWGACRQAERFQKLREPMQLQTFYANLCLVRRAHAVATAAPAVMAPHAVATAAPALMAHAVATAAPAVGCCDGDDDDDSGGGGGGSGGWWWW